MNKKLFVAFLILPFLVACTKNVIPTSLVITSVSAAAVDGTKAIVEGSAFPEGSAATIGVLLTGADGQSAYDGKDRGYNNIAFTKDAGSTKWKSLGTIVLSETKGKLYAYYPYSYDFYNLTAIPIESSINGKDYMYAVPAEGICESSHTTALTMKHALARVNINFVRDASFTKEGRLTQISLICSNLAQTGTLNAKDGAITVRERPTGVTFSNLNDVITDSGLTKQCLVIPVTDNPRKQTVTVKCIVDGEEYNTTFFGERGVVFKAGTISDITLNITR